MQYAVIARVPGRSPGAGSRACSSYAAAVEHASDLLDELDEAWYHVYPDGDHRWAAIHPAGPEVEVIIESASRAGVAPRRNPARQRGCGQPKGADSRKGLTAERG